MCSCLHRLSDPSQTIGDRRESLSKFTRVKELAASRACLRAVTALGQAKRTGKVSIDGLTVVLG